ncbi:exopolyphosphatase, partial [Helicobacter pylori]|nr:exopolyphosphatase [Helicobacter pylori]
VIHTNDTLYLAKEMLPKLVKPIALTIEFA